MRASLHATFADDIEAIADGITDLCELIEGSTPSVKLTATMIGDHDSRTSDVCSTLRVFNAHDAFEGELSTPLRAEPFRIVPAHGLIEHGGKIVAYRHRQIRAFAHVTGQVRHVEFLAQEEVQRPRWVSREAGNRTQRELGRRRETRAQIALPIASGNRVHGQRHDLEFRGSRSLEQRIVK